MKLYSVQIPFAGSVTLEIEAETEEQALELALMHEDLHVNNCDEEVYYGKRLYSGNVTHCPVNEANVEYVRDVNPDE